MPILTQQQEKDLETLIQEFSKVPPDDIKGLLQISFSVNEIRAILKAVFTHTQIMEYPLSGRLRICSIT